MARTSNELAIRGVVPDSSLAPGAEVRLAFRAENVALSRAAPLETNAWPGTVQAAVFLGLQTRYTVDLDGEEVVAVQAGSVQEFQPGESVVARLAPELVTILEVDGERHEAGARRSPSSTS